MPAARAGTAAAPTPLLRFITCGSVDDGKSTLVGRLLHDCGAVALDQLETLAADSRRHGTQGAAIDYALLVDGLSAEREQGITIDIAWRYFRTDRRVFIVGDTPGHEQYTRNMATAASTADCAIILVDATRGVQTQTRRHSLIAQLMGIRHILLAVTKMDLVGYAQDRFAAITADYAAVAEAVGLPGFVAVPVSGVAGDNVVARSAAMPWFAGRPLLAELEAAPVAETPGGAFLLPVQAASRPHAGFRGFAGLVAGGSARVGDAVRILPSGETSRIARIVAMEGDCDAAVAGQSVMLTLADERDCSRGSLIAAATAPPQMADQFEASLVWMAHEPLVPGRSYWLKLATQLVGATVRAPKHELNVNSMEKLAARTLGLNAIGVCELATDRPIAFAPYAENRTLGGFILIDRLSGATVAAGMLHFALRRAHNIHWQPTSVDRAARARLMQQEPRVLWFTGLSGAGKSTIANLVEQRLHRMKRHSFLLDGDNVRHGLNRDLGFTEADRVENIRRVGAVARLMADSGLIVLCAFISPFRADRQMVRDMLPPGEFVEIFVDTPLEDAERRDPKGLYAKARAGKLANFTGIDSPYEPPLAPEIRIDTRSMTADEAADLIVARIIP